MVASIFQRLAAGRLFGLHLPPLATIKNAARRTIPTIILNRLEAKYYETYGELELLLVGYLCRHDKDAIDVGANTGSYTYFMQRHAKLTYAFEPVPDFVQALATKFKRRVIVRNVALSDKPGTALLHIPIRNGERIAGLSSLSEHVRFAHAASDSVAVRTARLDDCYAGTVGFIKIDVEGHEEAVLRGARHTIHASRPRVLVEIEERHAPGAIDRIHRFFSDLNYAGFFAYRIGLIPLNQFDPTRLQRPETIPDHGPGTDRKRFSEYVNNFIFIPGEEAANLRRQLQEELLRRSRWLRSRQGRLEP